jgi:hypothetical protein
MFPRVSITIASFDRRTEKNHTESTQIAGARKGHVHAHQLTRVHKTLIIHALLGLIDGADRRLGAPAGLLRLVQAVVDVRDVLDLDAQSHRVATGKEVGGEGVRFVEGGGGLCCGEGSRLAIGGVEGGARIMGEDG